jgi:hypothetical protein
MAGAIPSQHPAVVLRSHYNHLRALLAVAMIAVVGLTAALVVVAVNDDAATPDPTAQTITRTDGVRYDGGPEEGAAAAAMSATSGVPSFGTRYDGGPEEGTRGAQASTAADGTRYDGGPEEGSRGPGQ